MILNQFNKNSRRYKKSYLPKNITGTDLCTRQINSAGNYSINSKMTRHQLKLKNRNSEAFGLCPNSFNIMIVMVDYIDDKIDSGGTSVVSP